MIAWCKLDGTFEKAKITEMYVTESFEQVPADRPVRVRSSRSPAWPR